MFAPLGWLLLCNYRDFGWRDWYDDDSLGMRELGTGGYSSSVSFIYVDVNMNHPSRGLTSSIITIHFT